MKPPNKLYEVPLAYDDLELLARALWDVAVSHTTYPRPHVDRLHALRRYLLAVQVASDCGAAWKTAMPAPPSEST